MATIVLVEDEIIIALCTGMILENAGHTVLIAANGEAGLALVLEAAPDLIVTDYMMPGMNGAELVRDLRGRGITTPIVLATSVPQHSVPGDRPPQYDAYLEKPYHDGALLEVVRRLLGEGQEPP